MFRSRTFQTGAEIKGYQPWWGRAGLHPCGTPSGEGLGGTDPLVIMHCSSLTWVVSGIE